MKPKNRAYNVVDVIQLQNKIHEAITEADTKGLIQCSVFTPNRYAVEDALIPFYENNYNITVFQWEGTIGRNLIRLPMTEIVIRLEVLK